MTRENDHEGLEGKDLEGVKNGLFEGTIQACAWRTRTASNTIKITTKYLLNGCLELFQHTWVCY